MTTADITAGMQPDIVIDGKLVYLTRHAIEATVARRFTIAQVFDTLANWENRYTQHRKYYGAQGEPAFMYQRGDIGVGVIETDKVIVIKTVLLREVRQWTNDDAVSRTPL